MEQGEGNILTGNLTIMATKNPFNIVEKEHKNPFDTISLRFDEPVVEPAQQLGPRVAPQPVAPPPTKTATISQGTTQPQKEPSVWNKIARTLLPKPAEDFFGLNDTQVQKDIKAAESAKQYEFAGGKSNFSGFIDSITDWDTKDIPFFGSGKEAVESVGLAQSAGRFEKGTAKPEDTQKLQNYYKDVEKETALRKNTGYAAGETVKGSLRFMGELLPVVISEALTAGVAPTGDAWALSQATKMGAKETLKKYATDSVFRSALTQAVKDKSKMEAATLAKQFALTAPTNVTGSAAERMIGNYDFETGKVIDPGQPIGTAIVNGISQQAVELLTERGGGITGKVLGKMAAPIKNVAVKSSIYNALKKALPKATNDQITALLKKTGWNGVVGEFFEERDADALNQILYQVGLGDQEFKGLTKEQIATELIAFTLMGAGVKVGTSVYEKAMANKPAAQEGIVPAGPAGPDINIIVSDNLQDQERGTTRVAYDELPDEAKGALQSQARTKITNEGMDMQQAVAEMKNKQFGREEILIADLQKSNPDIFSNTFTKRGSVTKGPILIDSTGEVLDGNNRVREAFERGETSIDSFVEKTDTLINENQDLQLESYPVKGPGYQKLVKFVDKMVGSGTIHPEEAPIIKALFEDTNDNFLSILNLAEDGRLVEAAGNFRITRNRYTGLFNSGSNLLKMSKGLARKSMGSSLSTFLHEYGHAGYYLVLSPAERDMVEELYNRTKKTEKKSLFEHFPEQSQNYYTKNAQEFWAQSFADYVMENKVSDKQLEPLLKRISKRFFETLKKIINRGDPAVISPMKPMFERILDGNWNSPLADYVKQEPSSFKTELQDLLKRIAPEASAQAAKAEAKKPIFSGSKPGAVNIPIRQTTENNEARRATVGGESVEGIIRAPKTPKNVTEAPVASEFPLDTAETIQKEGPKGTPPLEEVVEKKGNTPLEKRVRLIDYLRTPWKVLDKIGLRDAYQILLKSYEDYVTELPGNIDKITAWSKRVSKESNERIFRYLDGEDIELEGEEIAVAQEIKDWLREWADRLGMRADERISEYITHIFPINSKGEIPEELAVLINKKVAKSVYDPFLLQRQGVEGYLKDTWKALDAYTKRATRKVNMDPALKAFDEASKDLTDVSQLNYVEKYISRINMRPTNTDTLLDNEIKSRFGYTFGARPINNITRTFRQMISRAKIGGSLTSFAKNLTQGVNTFAELGTNYTLRGYLSLLKRGAAKELKDNNVMMGSFIEDRTYSAIKKAAELADKVLFLNMQASENINRGAAYFGAKSKFAAGKVKPREFREALGRDMPADYQPTMEDAIEYGKFVASKTQFKFDPLETPMALSSDIARTAAQFQTFGLKQAEFILGMMNGQDKMKLFRYLTSSMLIFHFIGGAFGMSWDDSFKTLRWGMPPIVQFLVDLWQGGVLGEDKYGNKLDAGERTGLVGKSLFTNVVPGGAQMQRTFEGLGAVSEGKSKTKAGKFEYKIDQTPENYARGALFGKYNLPEAKEYYQKKEDKKNKVKPKTNKKNPFDAI